MSAGFDSFIVFAEMRTGSNFLEANLNAIEGVTCHGGAFNPHFIGYPNKTEILGVTREMREDSPVQLIETIKKFSDGMGAFAISMIMIHACLILLWMTRGARKLSSHATLYKATCLGTLRRKRDNGS